MEAKRKLSSHHQSVAATGGGPSTPELTAIDGKIAAIIGEASVCGIVSEKEGDTDATETTEEQDLTDFFKFYCRLKCVCVCVCVCVSSN